MKIEYTYLDTGSLYIREVNSDVWYGFSLEKHPREIYTSEGLDIYLGSTAEEAGIKKDAEILTYDTENEE